MKPFLLVLSAFLISNASAQSVSYLYSIDDYGVDSFFLNETILTIEGALTKTVENRYFFSDTAKLTQFINEADLLHHNMDTEATRLRVEANVMEARVDSMRAVRAFAGLSIQGFGNEEVILKPDTIPGTSKDNKPANKPKKSKKSKSKAIRPKE